MKTFAISSDGKHVQLWCEKIRRRGNRIYFTVINGAWNGYIENDLVYIDGDEKDTGYSAKIVWSGEVPESHDLGYNTSISIDVYTSIAWIESQLDNEVGTTSPYLTDYT